MPLFLPRVRLVLDSYLEDVNGAVAAICFEMTWVSFRSMTCLEHAEACSVRCAAGGRVAARAVEYKTPLSVTRTKGCEHVSCCSFTCRNKLDNGPGFSRGSCSFLSNIVFVLSRV